MLAWFALESAGTVFGGRELFTSLSRIGGQFEWEFAVHHKSESSGSRLSRTVDLNKHETSHTHRLTHCTVTLPTQRFSVWFPANNHHQKDPLAIATTVATTRSTDQPRSTSPASIQSTHPKSQHSMAHTPSFASAAAGINASTNNQTSARDQPNDW